MAKPNDSSSRFLSHATKILFLALTIVVVTVTAQAAAPVGQTIWLRATATGLFVSADQNRGTWAPLVADRSSVAAWEQFQVVDAVAVLLPSGQLEPACWYRQIKLVLLTPRSSPIARA